MRGSRDRRDTSATRALSSFVAETTVEDVPEAASEAGKLCFLDWIGVALGGMNEPPVAILVDLLDEIGGRPQATVVGYGCRTDVLHAALVNGTMSHALDYDDAHMPTRNHPSAPLIPALLAVAESRGRTGSEVLAAYVLGFEVSTRIGLALGKGYYDLGWHATPVLGRFGVAAGVGKLLRLNAEALCRAFGLAATQAGGTRNTFGTMGKPFNAGKAAMDGALAAILAERGFTAPADALDETAGFVKLFSDTFGAGRLTEGLGSRYHVVDVSLKPHAACLLTHPVIDGVLSLRRDHAPDIRSVDRVELEVAPPCAAVAGNMDPKDGRGGKFSVSFCASLAFAEGSADCGLFTDEMVSAPRVRAWLEKIELRCLESLGESEASVTVRLSDGTSLTRHVTTPKGDPGNPLTPQEVVQKFRALAGRALAPDRMDRVIESVGRLDRLDEVGSILRDCAVEPSERARSAAVV